MAETASSDGLLKFLESSDDTKYASIVIPEWENRTVWVRSLTNSERTQWETAMKVKKRVMVKGKPKVVDTVDPKNAKALLVILATCKGDGDKTPVFNKRHLSLLESRNAAAVDAIFDVASALSNYTNEDLEDEVKNSDGNLEEQAG